jgi:hypothetical protein
VKQPHEPPEAARRGPGMLACLVVLAAAFLLFVLELAAAKAMLPRFGGSPMVWTTSMLVYQVLLLGGYAYAHGLARRGSGGVQAAVHIGVLAAAVALAGWRLHADAFGGGDPATISRHPMAALLWTLLGTIALPFIAVSATSPLVQHWQQRRSPDRSVYLLYAVSNVGSFAALLAYPFVIEPRLDVPTQLAVWKALFALTAIGLGALALRARSATPAPAAVAGAGPEPAARLRRRDAALWLALPATTSALLLAATNELCQDLAVFPFLWVVPLSMYLLTFVVAFREPPRPNALPTAAVATMVALGTTSLSLMLPAPVHIVSIGALVLVLGLAAHRELYRLRPPAAHLTAYYLCLAAGSGLGASCVALLAPVILPAYWEFHLALLALWIALIVAVALDRDGCLRAGDRRHAAALLGLVVFLILNRIPEAWLKAQVPAWPTTWSIALRIAAAAALAALLWRALGRRPAARSAVWPRVLAGLVLFFAECGLVQRVRNDRLQTGHLARNFFGVVRVQEVLNPATGIRVRQLTHGRINHGWQYLNAELHGLPTAYHSPSTGIGRLIRSLQEGRAALRIGVTGLGAGALAAYPRATDRIVFYEIDPQVVALSSGPAALFDFVNACPGPVEIVLGDARQSLQAELARGVRREYDVLALDAFSSDAIPMHLLTREAFALYLAHLAQPGGVLAVNISNRFLDLEPVLVDAARAQGLYGILVDSLGDPPVHARSLWVLLSRDAATLARAGNGALARPLAGEALRWTDHFSSPLPLLKWWTPQSRSVRFVPQRRPTPEDATAAGPSPSRTPAAAEE